MPQNAPTSLRESLSFGFEQTFTIPDWWTEPGFVATSDTPLKREKMELLAHHIARELGGRYVESKDIYNHLQYEVFRADGSASFVVTMDPGCIEVKTQPLLARQIRAEMVPLFAAAAAANVVPYRGWWYGIRTGTEGGCHVNMGGFTPETNPLRANPLLVLKYAAFFHNNPWIHYPFMGVDVGPGGNAMRMDEHSSDPRIASKGGDQPSTERFERLSELLAGDLLSAERVHEFFAGTPLIEDKHSAPSLYKFHGPLFLIEDRAVEALRSPEEFELIAELRLRILESLEKAPDVAQLQSFGPQLHERGLSSAWLWEGFEKMALTLGLTAEPYRVFFDRQFPRLSGGAGLPTRFELREGRRPRVITDVQKRGDLIISKTIDTSHGRLELHCKPGERIRINGVLCEPTQVGRSYQLLVDYQRPRQDGILEIALLGDSGEVDSAIFHLNNMMFTERSVAPPLKSTEFKAQRPGYVSLRVAD